MIKQNKKKKDRANSYVYHFAKERGFNGRFWKIKYLSWYFKNYVLIVLCSLAPFRIVTTFHRWRGVKIGEDVYISRGACIDHSAPQFIEIGNHVTIAYGAVILSHNREGKHGLSKVQKTKIEDNVFIGVNAVVLPGIKIGKGSTVGAGSVVNKDVPNNCTVAGTPAKIIRKI